MTIKETLRPNSRGDMVAVPGVFMMVFTVVIVSVYESYLGLIPLFIGVALLIAGIRIDDIENRKEGCTTPPGEYCTKHSCIHGGKNEQKG